MTHRTFVISDTHFSHANILNFKRSDDTPLRPFSTVEEMDEYMIEQWNKVVRPVDRVYHLGDAFMSQQSAHSILPRLNGHKKLIRGNHDIYNIRKTYLIPSGFEEVYGVRMLPNLGVIMTHVPIHECSLYGRWKFNVHGHLHANVVMKKSFKGDYPDPRYICVSVEHTNYAPVDLEELIATRS